MFPWSGRPASGAHVPECWRILACGGQYAAFGAVMLGHLTSAEAPREDGWRYLVVGIPLLALGLFRIVKGVGLAMHPPKAGGGDQDDAYFWPVWIDIMIAFLLLVPGVGLVAGSQLSDRPMLTAMGGLAALVFALLSLWACGKQQEAERA
jgi:hypothetical protein